MKAPKSFRLHIGIFGKRNTGKSSILNSLTNQDVSIVSEIAGTTTDPVEKPMELLPLGPVLFIDTAGIDDLGHLGEKRVAKTMSVFDRTDLGIIVSNFNDWNDYEQQIMNEFTDCAIPFIVVFNKSDAASEINVTLPKEIKGKVLNSINKNSTIQKDANKLSLTLAPRSYEIIIIKS